MDHQKFLSSSPGKLWTCHLVLGKVLDVHAFLVDIPLLIVALLLRRMKTPNNLFPPFEKNSPSPARTNKIPINLVSFFKNMRRFNLHLSIEIFSFRSKVTTVVISKVILQHQSDAKKETKNITIL